MFNQPRGFESRPAVAGFRRHQSKEFLIDHLKNANWQREGTVNQDAQDVKFSSNEQFWEAVLFSRRGIGLRWVELIDFQVTDWFPRTPGLYFSPNAKRARREAEHYVTREQGLEFYEPRGKMHMIQGGIGSVRFKPINFGHDDYWLCTATSSRYCHSGIPLAIPNILMEKIGFDFLYKFDISGQVRFLPDFLERHFYHMSRIPQIYISVDNIIPKRTFRNLPVKITPMVFFTGGQNMGLEQQENVTFVTCRSDSFDELDAASEWVDWYARRYEGKIITNFDQQRLIFEDAPFSLQNVMNGNIRERDLQQFHIQNAEVVVNSVNSLSMERVSMTKIDVKLGDNAVIHGDFVVANSIKNSFNQANSADISDELKTTLKNLAIAVGKMSEGLPDDQAKVVARDLETLTGEATSSSPRRRWWELSIEGLKKAAQDVGEIGRPVLELASQIVPLLLAAST